VKVPDDYSTGVALCCTGSVILVMVLYLGLTGHGGGLIPLISLSILLHITGLLLVITSIVINRWRTEPAMYYDWGL